MGEDDEGEAGEEEAGYVGDAQVGAAVETDGPRPWVEEMAQVTFFGGRDRILHKTSSRPHGQLQTLDVIEHRKAFQSVYSNSKRIA